MGASGYRQGLNIYTDGACSTNGTWDSAAAICVYVDEQAIYKHGNFLGKATNNIAELEAFKMGLEFLNRPIHYPRIVNIISDSAYIVNCFNQKWYENWEKNNWITSSKTPVKNKELWIDIIKLYRDLKQHYDITIIKTEGHANDKFNNEVDHLAVYCKNNRANHTEEI